MDHNLNYWDMGINNAEQAQAYGEYITSLLSTSNQSIYGFELDHFENFRKKSDHFT